MLETRALVSSMRVPSHPTAWAAHTRPRILNRVGRTFAACFASVSVLTGPVAVANSGASAHEAASPLEFHGRVEAVYRAEVSTRIDGRVKALLFEGGESVDEGQPLIELASAGLAIEVTAARAEVDRAAARLALAEQQVARLRDLVGRNAVSEAELQDREGTLAVARAEAAISEAALQQAQLRVEKATIRAPIAGMISRPQIAPGSFVEAKGDSALATIVQLDPVYVAYRVPYVVRLQSMRLSRTTSLEALFERIHLRIVLPDDQNYPLSAKPDFASAVVDPKTDTIGIWARVANPAGLLRPGMQVKVLSVIEGVGESYIDE